MQPEPAVRKVETAGAAAPEPTYWPLVLGIGITLLAAGPLLSLAFTGAGLLVVALGLGGWVHDLRREARAHLGTAARLDAADRRRREAGPEQREEEKTHKVRPGEREGEKIHKVRPGRWEEERPREAGPEQWVQARREARDG